MTKGKGEATPRGGGTPRGEGHPVGGSTTKTFYVEQSQDTRYKIPGSKGDNRGKGGEPLRGWCGGFSTSKTFHEEHITRDEVQDTPRQ